jgi:polyphosphate kinase
MAKGKKKGKKKDLDAPGLYFNRELSWLEFNDRVLREGLSDEVPLLERLKFLAIVSSNLDEFFMIRVSGLMRQRAARVRRRDISGLTPVQQLDRISRRVHRMVADQAVGIRTVLAGLREHGLQVLDVEEWTAAHRRFLEAFFHRDLEPVLTPLAMQRLDPPPLLPGLALNVALLLGPDRSGEREEDVIVIPVPGRAARFITVPGQQDGVNLVRLEEVIAAHAGSMFPGREVKAAVFFRITRDADVDIRDDDAEDLLQTVEEAVLARRRRAPVRLEISAHTNRHLRSWLVQWTGLGGGDVYAVDGMLDARALMEIAGRPGFEGLAYENWPSQEPRDLLGSEDLWRTLQDHDVLLFHPYEKFDPVVHLMEEAAQDPEVLAIKQTLYRTSGDSPVIAALERAAENGKQVTVLVELKARFDEARNVQWARRLEDAGCHVIYGIAGYKTHSKALLIVRREADLVRRYVHLGTGNYNDKTARLYSDIGLMTCDRDIATDVAAYFNVLTGFSEEVGWSKLTVAPTGLRRRFEELIDREIQASSPDRPGLILAKMNSLHDKGICKALYRAARKGVEVRLNVRGICRLRPGVKGVSENIEVTSIVDRFLEHARIFYFRNGGHEEVYLSSADWMTRNIDRRLEILFPVLDAGLRRRLVHWLDVFFSDNVKARRLREDGSYERIEPSGPRVRAQEALYREAVEAVESAEAAPVRFRPLTRPDE